MPDGRDSSSGLRRAKESFKVPMAGMPTIPVSSWSQCLHRQRDFDHRARASERVP